MFILRNTYRDIWGWTEVGNFLKRSFQNRKNLNEAASRVDDLALTGNECEPNTRSLGTKLNERASPAWLALVRLHSVMTNSISFTKLLP